MRGEPREREGWTGEIPAKALASEVVVGGERVGAGGLGDRPVQTIQTMRMLPASDRQLLLAAARRRALPRPTPMHPLDWPNERPRVYLDSHSLKSGGRLSAHAAFDTAGPWLDANQRTLTKPFYRRVIAVKDYDRDSVEYTH